MAGRGTLAGVEVVASPCGGTGAAGGGGWLAAYAASCWAVGIELMTAPESLRKSMTTTPFSVFKATEGICGTTAASAAPTGGGDDADGLEFCGAG